MFTSSYDISSTQPFANAENVSNPLSDMIFSAKKKIDALADNNGISVFETASRLLQGNRDALSEYVRASGVAPSPFPNKLIMQAALLRLAEIGTVANISNTNDDNAARLVEKSEYETIEANESTSDFVLKPELQAALLIVINNILSKVNKASDIDSAKDIVSIMKQKSEGFDNATGGQPDFNILNSLLGGETTSDSGQSGMSLGDWINTAVNSFTSIYSAIKGTGQTATQPIQAANDSNVLGGLLDKILNPVKDKASEAGTEALSATVKRYAPYIIGGFIIFILSIILVVYAVKRK